MEYKQKLDSPFARVLEKNAQENFEKILPFCPTLIQEKTKKRLNINKLLTNDPLADEFIKLNHKISINKDNEEVKEFSDAIFHFLDSLFELVKFVHKDFKFRVIPTGSFPVNIKICDMDEFDFVLFWENISEQYELEEFQTPGNFTNLLSTYKTEIIDLIKKVLTMCKEYDNISEIRLFWKTYAINIEFCWFCSLNHKHSVSLDLAISIKTTTTLREYYRRKNLSLKNTPFEQSIDYNENIYWNKLLSGGCPRIDTNIFDKQLFETCDAISPNIKLCFRILKFVRDCFFPCFWRKRKDHVSEKEEYYITQRFSSYLLKQVLFQEVIEFQCSEVWKNNCIHLRIASMLQKCLDYYLFKDILDTETKVSPFHRSEPCKTILNKLILWLYGGCREHSAESESLEDYFLKNMIVVMENNLLVKVPKSISFHHLIETDREEHLALIIFSKVTSKLFGNSVFRGLCETFIDSMDWLDLTVFSEKEQGKIFVLLLFSVIEKEGIMTENCLKKLDAFTNMLDSYGMLYNSSKVLNDRLVPRVIKLGSASNICNFRQSKMISQRTDPVLVRWEKIFSHITWKERGNIYQYILDILHNERALENEDPVQQFLVEAFDISCRPGYIKRDDVVLFGDLWLSISLNFLKSLK